MGAFHPRLSYVIEIFDFALVNTMYDVHLAQVVNYFIFILSTKCNTVIHINHSISLKYYEIQCVCMTYLFYSS